MQRLRELTAAAGVAHAVEAAVVGCVGPPARHAADVKLRVGRIYLPAVNTRAEFADQRHGGALRLTGDLIPQHEKMAALAGRKVDDLIRQWPEALVGDECLAAAAVVQAAWQIDHRQRGRLTVLRALVSEVRRRFLARP